MRGKMRTLALVLILGVLCLPASGQATDREAIFAEANALFHEANSALASDPAVAGDLFRKSLLRFERLVAEGVQNGQLYYNIGNVYFRLNDIGRAIASYRRAERFIPDDPNLRQNLSAALAKRRDAIEERQEERVLKTLFFWHYDLSFSQRAMLFGSFYICLWGFALIRLKTQRPFALWGLMVALVGASLFLGSLLADRFFAVAKPQGVLVAPEVMARKGDGDAYQPSFQEPLHSGTEFILQEDRGQWWRIELADGRTCWVPSWSGERVK